MKTERQYHDMRTVSEPRYSLALLTPEEFFNFWPGIEKMLDTVPHTWKHWTKDWIQSNVSHRQIQVWAIGPPPYATCIFFTQISIHPAFRSFVITWSAGRFDDEMIPLLETAWVDYAKNNDCEEIAITGRPGWGPKLKPLGFSKDYTTWTRRVPSMRMN